MLPAETEISMKKIAFIKIGNFSLINPAVTEVLRKNFPGHDIDVFDVRDWVRPRSAINLFFALKEFGWKIAWLNWDTAAWRTSYFHNKIKATAARCICPGQYMFSFQTQSVFDASVPGLPHFVYTDATHGSVTRQFHAAEEESKPVSVSKEIWTGISFHKNRRWLSKIKELVTRLMMEQMLTEPEMKSREQAIYQQATFNFTMGTDVHDSLIFDYGCPRDRVACVFRGIPGEIVPSKTRFVSANNEKVILFVGLDWERKGGPQLMAAFRIVSARHPQAVLKIIGATPEIKTENCHCVGLVPANQMGEYYQQATVFCLPSLWELCASALIEAAHYRLPIVTTATGSSVDIVQDGVNGYCVKPGDVAGLAAALDTLLSDPGKCRRFGERGQQMAGEKFTWDHTGRIMKRRIEDNLNRTRVSG